MSARELAEQLEAFAVRWRKSMARGYDAVIYEIDNGAPSHTLLTVQMVEAGAAALRRVEALEAAMRRIEEADYINQLQGTANFERLQSIARAALKGGSDEG